MKLKLKIKKAKNLKDGDIFYYTPEYLKGDEYDSFHPIGREWTETGADQIFINDGFYDGDKDSLSFLVNGGYMLTLEKNENIMVIGHYSKLLNLIEIK